jgi:hypothetical protein
MLVHHLEEHFTPDLGLDPIPLIRLRVSSLIWPFSLITIETVAALTPARSAIMRIVGFDILSGHP